MIPQELLSHFEARRDSILSEIRELVDIESPSFDAAASARVADWVEQRAGLIGAEVTVERIAADGVGEHVLIRAFGTALGRRTLILGHTDTVHPIGTAKQNPTRVEGDRLYGCGVFDMKANVVLMLEALRYLVATGTRPGGPITILLSCDEEVGSHSGREHVEREASDAARCLVLEPSAGGRVKTGRKGTGTFQLNAHGIPAHAGLEPEKGANAIAELARQIERIHAVARPEVGTTVNVTTIQGGTTTNVIPEHASCQIDVRYSVMDEAERIGERLRGLQPVDGRVSLELKGEINRPPLERTAAVAALYETAREIAATFGYELGETQVGGGSDGNFVGALGVPVLDGLGSTGDGAHRLDEHILISDLAPRATLLTMLLA